MSPSGCQGHSSAASTALVMVTHVLVSELCKQELANATIDDMNDSPTKPVPVRIPPELVARIDSLRGLIPREAYVRHLLERAVGAEEQGR